MANVLTRSTAAVASRRRARENESTRRLYLWLAIPLVLSVGALILRMHDLDHEPLWLDEGYTLMFSGYSLSRLVTIGGAHEHPPLYYGLVHLLLSIHYSHLVPRLVSAVAGSCSVFVLYLLGTRLFGRTAGLIAAILLAVSPFHVWYSRDGRAYELAGLWVLLSYLSLLVVLDRPRDRRLWVAYALCLALAMYTEYTTVLVLLPQVALLARARQQHVLRRLIESWALACLLMAPWIGMLARNVSSVATDYWIPPPTSAGVVNTLVEFLGGITPCSAYPCTGNQAQIPLMVGHASAIAFLLVTGVVAALAVALWRRHLPVAMMALWLLLPFALVLLLSLRRSIYLDRVFLDATFPLYLLIGALVVWASRRWVTFAGGVLLLVLLGILGIANTRLVYSDSSNPDWKAATRDFALVYRPGQAVVYNPGVLQTLVGAYLPQGWRPTREIPLWYHNYLDLPGWQDRYADLAQQDLDDPHILPSLRYGRLDNELRNVQLAPLLPGTRQVWLVTEDYSGLNDARRWFLLHGYQLILSETYIGDARIELWDLQPPSNFGPAVFQPDARTRWQTTGKVTTVRGVITEKGHSEASRSFALSAGRGYTVGIQYRTFPPGSGNVLLQTFDASGQPTGTLVDRFGTRLNGFPRTEWYLLPATGTWTSQPFGFVAPPGTTHGVLALRSLWGMTQWRGIGVFEER